MDRDTLEKLLIDRQLGELPSEVAELLEAYLAFRPDRAEAESDVAETLELARRTLKSARPTAEAPVPPLTARPSRHARFAGWGLGAWARRGAIAAMIVFSFALGKRVASTSTPTSTTLLAGAGVATPADPKSSESFWSLTRLQQETARRATRSREHVGWTAPFVPSLKGEQS